jgi:hypothetical protein
LGALEYEIMFCSYTRSCHGLLFQVLENLDKFGPSQSIREQIIVNENSLNDIAKSNIKLLDFHTQVTGIISKQRFQSNENRFDSYKCA